MDVSDASDPPADLREEMAKLAPLISEAEPESHGDMWIDSRTQELVLGLPKGSAGIGSPLAAEVIERASLPVRVDLVERSTAELKKMLAEVYRQPGLEEVTSAYADFEHNRIVVTAKNGPNDEIRSTLVKVYGSGAAIESGEYG